jgi:hypothetical protein
MTDVADVRNYVREHANDVPFLESLLAAIICNTQDKTVEQIMLDCYMKLTEVKKAFNQPV